MDRVRHLLAIVALAACPALAGVAGASNDTAPGQTDATEAAATQAGNAADDDATQAGNAADDDATQAGNAADDDATQAGEATEDPATGASDAADPGAEPAAEPIDPDAKLDGYPGMILRVMADGILVRRAGPPTDPRAPPVMAFVGDLGVRVEGQGKDNWLALRRGDLVMVSYVKGPPHRIAKVNVLPNPALQRFKATPPAPNERRQRKFIGYIKKKEGDELIVMTPRTPPPRQRQGEVKAFIRTPETRVSVLRDSWDDLRKGDRVLIGHQKGNPRPIDMVQVIRRAGEEPLPPGLATRLFDPKYDKSVRDVDGIGEVPRRRAPQRKSPPMRVRIGGEQGSAPQAPAR